jgi:hypothetical protein
VSGTRYDEGIVPVKGRSREQQRGRSRCRNQTERDALLERLQAVTGIVERRSGSTFGKVAEVRHAYPAAMSFRV